MRLKEHTHHPLRTELKLAGGSGQFGFEPRSGQIAFADTDHMYEVEISPTAHEMHDGGKSRQDLALAFARSVVAPIAAATADTHPQIAELASEIEERHALLRPSAPPRARPISQLSFSCIAAWLGAVARAAPSSGYSALADEARIAPLPGAVPLPDILRVNE